MGQSEEHIELEDLPIEVTIEPGARFSGTFSDVYKGRFGDKIVRLHDAPLRNTRLMLTLRWL
jgi:hypothetical protein